MCCGPVFCWLPGELEDHRTSIWIGSQEDPEFWDELVESVPPIDIVIDDGSHVGRMQLETFQSLWPRLAPGGVYIVEDMVLAYLDMPSQDCQICLKKASQRIVSHSLSWYTESFSPSIQMPKIRQDTDFYRGRTEWIEKLKQLVDEMQTGGIFFFGVGISSIGISSIFRI